MTRIDVIIIGAGPAGLAAADTLHNYDIDVMIIDEQARPGGQIYRQPPAGFKVSNWLPSRIYDSGKQLLEKVTQLEKIQWLFQTTVLGITANAEVDPAFPHKVTVCTPGGMQEIDTRCVLIAPGCHDMAVIFPGWNLPGVMATGGIQAFVKSQQLVPGERFVFAGTHPLQLIVADQIIQAGGKVAGVIFAQSFTRVFALLKSPAILFRNLGKLLYMAAVLLRLRRAGVPLRFNETIIQANGEEILGSVNITAVGPDGSLNKDSVREIACDRLGVCFSFLASSEIARQYGADYAWSTNGGGWIIKHNEWMCSTIPGVYVAGEITGVAGAEVAAEEGKLAALGIVYGLGKLDVKQVAHLAKPLRNHLLHLNRFADILKNLSYPHQHLLEQLMTEAATLCKCEQITVAEFKQHLMKNPHINKANAAKLLTRAGMGLCQGRYCNYPVTRILARHASVAEYDIGPFTARFPAKPVSIRDLIE